MGAVNVICPCCKWTGVRIEYMHGFWCAVCASCGARTQYKETQREALDAWNAGEVRGEDEDDANS